MKYERFVDEVRMITSQAQNNTLTSREVARKLKPHITNAAHQGKTYISFEACDGDTISPLAAWVDNHWAAVSDYFESQGFVCEVGPSDELIISWD